MNKKTENAIVWFVGMLAISVLGFVYAIFIMLAWNKLAVRLCDSLSEITYVQSYLVYLFFVVLPRIMPIRFTTTRRNADGKQG